MSRLRDVVSGCTVPPHPGVDSQPIPIGGGRDGFAVTYIPKSLHCPHQTTGTCQYYMRVGSSFAPVPHAVLAGLFGRRPNPLIGLEYHPEPRLSVDANSDGAKVRLALRLAVHNHSIAVAHSVFVVARATLPGPLSEVSYSGPFDRNSRPVNFVGSAMPQQGYLVLSEMDFRLPPEGTVFALNAHLGILPPLGRELRLDFAAGCEGGPLARYACSCGCDALAELHRRAVEMDKASRPLANLTQEFLLWERIG